MNREIVLPRNAKKMSDTEMEELLGGSITLGMLNTFTSKDECMYWAIKVVDHGSVKGMTYQEVAEEIYAHAYVYYNFNKLPNIVKNNGFAQSVYNSSANGISIDDNGDTTLRKAFYSLVWTFC